MNVNKLPVMKICCKTCPFKLDENGVFQNVELVNKVTDRTLFKGQQICHSTQDFTKKGEKSYKNRCKGSFDYNNIIYKRLKLIK